MKSKPFIWGKNAVCLKEIAIFCDPAYTVLYVKIIQTRFGNYEIVRMNSSMSAIHLI